MDKYEKKAIAFSCLFFLTVVTIFAMLLVRYGVNKREVGVTKVCKVCKVLQTKHESINSSNSFGSFDNTYHFLYLDGSLKEVNLKTFMSYNEGDTVCFLKKY